MTTVTSWKPEDARKLFAKLTKVANEMLDVAQAPAPEDGAGSAGPQEVVDALDVIVDQLEEVQAAIPAEPSAEEGPGVEAPVDEPVAEEPVPEEEPKLAKQVRELTAQLERVELEKVAKTYGELFGEPKVQQAKYEEVLSSGKDSKYWVAKIEAISEFTEIAGVQNNSYQTAKNVSSWVMPRTKVAKQSSELLRL